MDYERGSGQASLQACSNARRSVIRRSSARRSGTKMTRLATVARSGVRRSANRRSGFERLTVARLSAPRSTRISLDTIPALPLLVRPSMLSHSWVECSALFVQAALRLAPLQLVARTKVDEARIAGQPRVDFLYAPEHLLRDHPVVRMALRRRPQPAHLTNPPDLRPSIPT